MSSINFDKFDTEYETRKLLRDVVGLFDEQRIGGNQRFNNNEPGGRLHRLLSRLKMGQHGGNQENPFDFELGEPLTIDEVMRLCRTREIDGVLAPVNVPDMLKTSANRLFFNENMGDPPVYVEVSRPENSDFTTELHQCRFLDDARNVIDWTETLPLLKVLAKQRVYTEEMMKQTLSRLLDKYQSDIKDLVRDMTSNEIANFLLSMEKHKDKTIHRRRELMDCVRKPETNYQSHLILFKRMLDRVYPADRVDTAMQRSVTLRTAIVSFLPDELALNILEKNRISTEQCEPMSDDEFEQAAYESEERFKIIPLWPLKYGRVIGSVAACHQIQLNSIENNLVRNPTYTTYPNPYQYLIQGPENEAAGAAAAAQRALILQQAAAAQMIPPARHAAAPNQGAAVQQMPPLVRAPQEQIADMEQARARQLAALQIQFNQPLGRASPATLVELGTKPKSTNVQQAMAQAHPSDLALPVNLEVPNAVGEIQENQLKSGDQVFRRAEQMYANIGGSIYKVVEQMADCGTVTRLQSNSGLSRKELNEIDQALRTSNHKKTRQTHIEPAELYSIDVQKDKMEQMLELMSVSFQEAMSEVKKLSQAGALSSSTRDRSQSRDRSQVYKRGSVTEGRYSSRDRNGKSRSSDRTRDASRGRSRDRTDRFRNRSQSRNHSRESRDVSSRRDRERLDSRGRDSFPRGRDSSFSKPTDRVSRHESQDRGRSGVKKSDGSRISSRRDQSRDKSRDRSLAARQTYPKMRKGENCRLSYDPLREKSCSKCTRPYHHEFECYKYDRFNIKVCTVCDKGHHFAGDCKEVEKFPPKDKELNSVENW